MNAINVCIIIALLAFKVSVNDAQNVAEGYFVVDDETVEAYMRNLPGTTPLVSKRSHAVDLLRKDIDYILTEVNFMFATLASTVSLEVRIKTLEIMTMNVFSGWTFVQNSSSSVNGDQALKQFDSWLQTQNAYSAINYDFALLWTGYELRSDDRHFTGYSYIGTICDSKLSSGIVQYNMTYLTVIATAHEIAHILGADHGGAATDYIMAFQPVPQHAHRWAFSTCTAQDILANINKKIPNCLTNTSATSIKPAITYGQYKGHMLEPDYICKRYMNDSRSYMCKGESLYANAPPGGNTVCSQIYCQNLAKDHCEPVFTSEGMVCNPAMRCKKGTCTADSSAPSNLQANCVFGDFYELNFVSLTTNYTGTCAFYLDREGASPCYDKIFREQCCQSCQDLSTGHSGCEYGDKSTDCVMHSQSSICPQYKDTLCCGYCNGYVS